MNKKVNFDKPIYMNFHNPVLQVGKHSLRVYCATDRHFPSNLFPFTVLKETCDSKGRPYFRIYMANKKGFVLDLEDVTVTNKPLYEVH
jgi:hypothetical protein